MTDINVLIIEDDDDDYLLITEHLKDIVTHNFNVTWAATYDEGLRHITTTAFDICLVDFLLGKKTGLNLLSQVREKGIETPIILLTGRGNRDIDNEAMLAGATDYVIKSELEANTLERSIRYAISHAQILNAVKANERLYRNIFHRSRDMIYLADTGKGVFIDVNEQATQMFGYSRAEFMMMSTADILFDKNDRDKLRNELLETGEIKNAEAIFLTKTGEKRVCIISGVFYTEGGILYHHGTIQDVTELRLMERHRMNTEKLAAAGRFTRALAHEVRNPLTNIHLSVEQIEMDNVDEEMKEYVSIIKRNSHRIGNLITQLLQTSNPAHLSLEKHAVNYLLEKIVEMNRDRITLKNIEIITDYALENVLIDADELQLKIALSNLIVNAIESTEENKGIIKITTQRKNSVCHIIIEDNGCGMTATQQDRLFEPYFTGKSKGLGLGMTTSMSIIQAHGGTINFTSEVGKGTLFMMGFPIVD